MSDDQKLAIDMARLQVAQEHAEREMMQMVQFVEASVERLANKIDGLKEYDGELHISVQGLKTSLGHIEMRMNSAHESFRAELADIKHMVEENTRFRQQVRAWSIGVGVGAGITGGGIAAGITQLLG